MDIHFTARKFKAHATIKDHAIESIKLLDRLYDGIVRCDIILSYEKSTNSQKIAEVTLHVQGTSLIAKEKSDDFHKSIELAVEKLERQLGKYKSKLRKKNKKTLRRVKEEIVIEGKDE